MVARFGNSSRENSKLGQVTYLNTLSFHSCGFQLMVHATPKSSTFRCVTLYLLLPGLYRGLQPELPSPLTVSDICHLIMNLAYIKANEVHEQKYSRYLLWLPTYNLQKLFKITVFLGVTPHSLADPE
jgi:hypothetical protein